MNKFEKLIEYVVNDEDAKAQSLFHQIVVDKSRKIYEGLMDDDNMGGNEVDELINDVESDESGFGGMNEEGEDEHEFSGEGGDEFGGPADMDGDEFGGPEMDGMGDETEADDLEGRVIDLEQQLDDLMSEFDTMVGGEDEITLDGGSTWTDVGAADNVNGTIFTATGQGVGTGTATPTDLEDTWGL